MRLRYTARAAADIEAIADYLVERSPDAAQRVRTAILRTLQTVVLFPESGRLQSVPDVRKLVTRRYAYLIYYRVDREADEIVVLTVQHSSRRRAFTDR